MSEDLNQNKLYRDFKDLYEEKEKKSEEIYNFIKDNMELTKYLSKEESSEIIKIILDKSDSKIKQLEADYNRALDKAIIIGGMYIK